MNQADVTKLMSKLRIKYTPIKRKLRNPEGPPGEHKKIRKTLTALLKYERIELNYRRADETRGYAERLISDAIRHGDCHRATMELADYWIEEKQLVHKLFKVLVPRFENSAVSYTRMYRAPMNYPTSHFDRAVLELRGNPFPPLKPDLRVNRNLIHNVLLDEAHKEFRSEKYAEIAQKLENASAGDKSGDVDKVARDFSEKILEPPVSNEAQTSQKNETLHISESEKNVK